MPSVVSIIESSRQLFILGRFAREYMHEAEETYHRDH